MISPAVFLSILYRNLRLFTNPGVVTHSHFSKCTAKNPDVSGFLAVDVYTN